MVETGWWRLDGMDRMVETGWWRLDGGDWMVETGWWRLDGGDRMVETGWCEQDGGDWMVGTGWYELDAEVCMKQEGNSLCDRLKCARTHWELKNNGQGQPKDFWDNNVSDKLNNLFNGTTTGSTTTTSTYCNDNSMDNANKEACELITAKLEQMYQNKNGDPNKYSNQMIQCLLLKEYAKKLKKKAKEGGYCSIDKGISHAFTQIKSIMEKSGDHCKGSSAANCFECKWGNDDTTKNELDQCTIPNGTTLNAKVKDEVVKLFEGNTQTKGDEVHKTLTDFNNKNPLCERLQCLATEGQAQKGNNNFWEVGGEVAKLWQELADKVKGTNGTGSSNECDAMQNPSDKAACNFLHAGFEELYKAPDATSAAPTSPSPSGDDILSTKHPSFRQTMGCFLLHAYAKHMKSKAICNIDKGIQQAFDLWKEPKNKAPGTCSGTGKGPCVPCQWDKDKEWEKCKIKTNGPSAAEKAVKEEVEEIVKVDDPNTNSIMENINTMTTLCDHMECIASHLNSSTGQQKAKNFWEEGSGEVHKLWQELAEAMMAPSVNGQCNQMDDNGRTPTNPERKACQYLTAGFKKLKQLTPTATSKNKEYPILSEHASFVQTMGCFLLHSYAKKMESDAKCSVESGIKKAFETAGKDLKGGQCIWGGSEYESCQINAIVTNAKTEKTPVKNKLKQVKNKIDGTLTNTMKDMNETKSLCAKLQCAAGKWFEKHSKGNGGSGTDKKTWCEFWEQGVRTALQTMFKEVGMKGQSSATNPNAVCNDFGDGNVDSVERRACSYITAGLQHIKEIPNSITAKQPDGNENQLLQQAVGCIALNMYADKIIELTAKNCPIDESKIKEMFEKWNANNKIPCPTSAGNTKDCSVCDRVSNSELKNCQLSVDKNLINTPKNGSCPDDNDKDKVHTQINKFLEDKDQSPSKSISEVNTTLTSITNISTSSFCTQLQCAAKKYAEEKKGTPLSSDEFWGETSEGGQLWTELSNAMKATEGNGSGTECTTVDDNGGRDATDPEKRACNYLHVGLKQLYKPGTSTTGNNGILSGHPSLRRTLGCLLLREYAKKMKETSKCVIDSGIEKAFKAFQNNNTSCTNSNGPCIECKWEDNIDSCTVAPGTDVMQMKTKIGTLLEQKKKEMEATMKEINVMSTLCDYIRCAGPKWFKNHMKGSTGTNKKDWSMFKEIEKNGKDKSQNNKDDVCNNFGDGNDDSVERKACNHITAGLQYIKTIEGSDNGQNTNVNARAKADDIFFKQTMMCTALNLYADKIKKETDKVCPIGEDRINQMFDDWNKKNNILCSVNGVSNNNCFTCGRNEKFGSCDLLLDENLIGTPQSGQNCNNNGSDNKDVPKKMNKLLQEESKMDETLTNINEMKSSFCTQVQCAAKKWKSSKNGKNGLVGTLSWGALSDEIGKELTELLKDMNSATKQSDAAKYCNDNNPPWYKLGHKERKTNKAACLLFAAGLQHIYTHGNGRVNGPSFEQTMGCLFLKEYAKQLQTMANKKKQGNSWVHPKCDIDKGIEHAFNQSNAIMSATSPCNKNGSTNSCFVCIQNEGYETCRIGTDSVKGNVEPLLQSEQTHMQQTLENTVCPILLTDLLTPFLPLAPVSIGLSAMAYYLWKYFGPLGKGGPRFRRSPTEIPGPSVQEQVLDHVQQDSSHEYRLVKERKPRSAPTRTKRSGPVNRRTIIEIHFEVLDECQKGDTQLNQKDFLELLVQEFMGSELMEEEQVPKENVLMEEVPMERVPSLGSGLLV
ncbi:SICAvar, type I [Plasmodium knowlesi strain H]|uniref:SICAvar, type I n=1 Tax=Plasmodium knowlesi (strain H) TaxID=5851 RepID=A0A1A7VKA7_PLAKH|nr:SICAvar, type I [Plasmodium knowlesi strain H]